MGRFPDLERKIQNSINGQSWFFGYDDYCQKGVPDFIENAPADCMDRGIFIKIRHITAQSKELKSQSISPSSVISRGSTITLTISPPYKLVPFLLGKKFDDDGLGDIRGRIGIVDKRDTKMPAQDGIILGQKPEAGQPLPSDKQIDVIVGKYVISRVPNLIGKHLDDTQVRRYGDRVVAGGYLQTTRLEGDNIIARQSMEPGEPWPDDQILKVFVTQYSPPAPPPNLVGKRMGDPAVEALLPRIQIRHRAIREIQEIGQIFSQDPLSTVPWLDTQPLVLVVGRFQQSDDEKELLDLAHRAIRSSAEGTVLQHKLLSLELQGPVKEKIVSKLFSSTGNERYFARYSANLVATYNDRPAFPVAFDINHTNPRSMKETARKEGSEKFKEEICRVFFRSYQRAMREAGNTEAGQNPGNAALLRTLFGTVQNGQTLLEQTDRMAAGINDLIQKLSEEQ